MDKSYWTHFYETHDSNPKPSNFASFLVDKPIMDVGTICDVGCGDGRDAYFFSEHGYPCIGIDQCLVDSSSGHPAGLSQPLLNFFRHDFTDIEYDSLVGCSLSIYSRFTLHALNYSEEEMFFENLERSKLLKFIFIEVRSINDSLYGEGDEVGLHEFVTTHYRRFIDPKVLRSRLESKYIIDYFEEDTGFSPLPTEDPCLIRVIARTR